MEINKVVLVDTKDNTIGDIESCLPNDNVCCIGHFTNFKHFYLQQYAVHYKDRFPELLPDNSLVELAKKVAIPMIFFVKMHNNVRCTGIGIVDSI